MLTIHFLLAAALLGLLVTVLWRIAVHATAPMLCRRLGHKPRPLGDYVRVCERCGRHV